MPLSSVLSPLLRRGERQKKGAPKTLRNLRKVLQVDTSQVAANHANDAKREQDFCLFRRQKLGFV